MRGTVQGVGFRPFVYNLARSLSLNGFVLNSGRGVVIEVEGAADDVQSFLLRLRAGAPPLAGIDEVAVTDLAANGECGFEIRQRRALFWARH